MEVIKNRSGEVVDEWMSFGENFRNVLEETARREADNLSSSYVEPGSITVARNGLLAADLLLSNIDVGILQGGDFKDVFLKTLGLGLNLNFFNPLSQPKNELMSSNRFRTLAEEKDVFNRYLLLPLKKVIEFLPIIKIEGANKRSGFIRLLSSSGIVIEEILRNKAEMGLKLSDDDENKLFQYLFKAEHPNFEGIKQKLD